MITCAYEADYFVELDEFGAVSPGTEFCMECGRLIPQGEEHYRVWEWTWLDDEKTHKAQHRCCEACGDLALSWMDLGYCWSHGDLRGDIAEVMG